MSIVYVYRFNTQSGWLEETWNAYAPLAGDLTLKAAVKLFVETAIPKILAGTIVSASQIRTVGTQKIKISVVL